MFFLDEATSFAAGHRPCAFCRRQRFDEFKAAWAAANGIDGGAATVRAPAIDSQLHCERIRRSAGKSTYFTPIDSMPEGTMIVVDGEAYLVWAGRLHRWSFDGYTAARPMPSGAEVEVLTPPSIVRLFDEGFVPGVHESAR